MLSWTDFSGNVEAHLQYVLAHLYSGRLTVNGALEEVNRHLERRDGADWSRAPQAWLSLVRWIARHDGDVSSVHEALVDAITKADKVEAVPPILQGVMTDVLRADRTDLAKRLVNWFVGVAGPGDAKEATGLLELGALIQGDRRNPLVRPRAADSDDTELALDRPDVRTFQALTLPDYFTTLVHWVLEKGSGELRQPDHSHLLPLLVDLVQHEVAKNDAGAVARLELALRYVARSPMARNVFSAERSEGVWPAVETALHTGCSATLALDLLASVGDEKGLRELAPESIFLPLASPDGFPLARAAILKALAAETLPDLLREHAWPYAFEGGPEGLEGLFTRLDTVDRVSVLFAQRLTRAPGLPSYGHPSTLPIEDELRPRWACLLAREVVRLSEITRTNVRRVEARRILGILASWEPEGTRLGLRVALEPVASDARFAGLFSVLSPQEPAEAVITAPLLWPNLETMPPTPAPEHEWITPELNRVISLPVWVEPVQGVNIPAPLGLARHVDLESLKSTSADEDQVRVVGDRLLVDRDVVREILGSEQDRERALARCVLHLFHELVHLPQGIGRKPDVTRLRVTGSESTLLHIDLGADHAAALLSRRALPSWDLVRLKDLLGRAVAGYPVTSRHPATARLRKAVRLVSLRVDYVVRASADGGIRVGDHEYLFADFGPGGGEFAVLASGPPFRVLKIASLSSQDAVALLRAADEGRTEKDLPGLDDLLRRLLRAP